MTEDADKFENADYYAVGDWHERLSHSGWEEAILEHTEEWEVSELPRHCPLTVFAYRRATISDNAEKGMVESLLERFCDDFQEGYGDPEDETTPSNAVVEIFQVAVAAALKHMSVWTCHPVAERTFELEEVLAIEKAWRGDDNG